MRSLVRAILGALLIAGGCTSSGPSQITTTSKATMSTRADDSTTTPAATASTAPPATSVAPSQQETLLAALNELGDPVRVGLVAHRASMGDRRRTIDVLHEAAGIELIRIFTPEHGLTGTADAGEPVADGTEPLTGIPIRSLYGTRRAPEPSDLEDLDAIVYDLQDVGVRAFTYIATMGLVFDAAAAAGIPVLVIDRTNPQGRVVDGPVRAPELESFVSPYPIPAVYGLTSGELALLLLDHQQLDQRLDLRVIGPAAPLADPWIPPSPNLPTRESAWLYPAVVLFEATVLSEGRGTPEPFTVIGGPGVDAAVVVESLSRRRLPGLEVAPTTFTPQSIPEMSPSPRYEGQRLSGVELAVRGPLPSPFLTGLELIDAFMDAAPDRASVIDRPDGFDLLTGDRSIRLQLIADVEPGRIAAAWQSSTEEWARDAVRYHSP